MFGIPIELCIIIYEEFDSIEDKQNYVFCLGEPILYEMHINYITIKNKEIIEITGTLYDNISFGEYDDGDKITKIINVGDFFRPDIMDSECPTLILLINMRFISSAIEFIDKFPQYCYPGHILNNGYSTLMWVVDNGDCYLLSKFINTFYDTCNPGYIDEAGDTALIVACRNSCHDDSDDSSINCYEIITFELIKKFGSKCNISHKNKYGIDAFHYVIKNKNEQLINEFSKYIMH